MKKNNLLIFKSLLPILPLITLAIFPTFINSIEEINQSLNNKNQTTSDQNQEINFETTIELTNSTSGSQDLFNHSLDKSGFINIDNSFEFDLNKFKPWGMETDLFLENTKISLSGPVVSGSFKHKPTITYKKRKITPSTALNIQPNSFLKVDKDILGNYQSTDTKIFTFDENDEKESKAYITINKILDTKTNILKIRPRIVMEDTNTINATTPQKLSINFSSPFFSFEPRDKILGNQYVSL